MSDFSSIWNLILHSNTFNFALFVLILIVIAKKVDIPALLENMQANIEAKIIEAKKAKATALDDLENAEKSVENLGTEIKKILGDAETSAKVMSEKILEDAEKQVQNIEENAKKVINSEEKSIISTLTNMTSKKSVDLAEQHIKKILHDNHNLHEKFIKESIDTLDRLKI